MENKTQQVVERFRNGYNCAQSVLSTFADDLEMPVNLSLKLASPFGSGIAYLQDTCGAVTGSLMAIGLKFGKGENDTEEKKTHAYKVSQQFIAEFKKIHGTTCCRQLMNGYDMSSPEGMAEIMKDDLFRINCVRYIRDAVTITEKLLAEG